MTDKYALNMVTFRGKAQLGEYYSTLDQFMFS